MSDTTIYKGIAAWGGAAYYNGCIYFTTLQRQRHENEEDNDGGLLFDLRTHAFSRFALPDTNPTQRELIKILEIQGCLSAVDMSKDPPLVVELKKKAAAAADDNNNNNTGTGVAWSVEESITLPSHQSAIYSTNYEFTLWTVLCRV